jgi:hypothetical protein
MNIQSAQRKKGYPTSEDYLLSLKKEVPLTEINFQPFGGRLKYQRARDMYWYKFHKKKKEVEVASKFGIDKDECHFLLSKFNAYRNEPVKYYE